LNTWHLGCFNSQLSAQCKIPALGAAYLRVGITQLMELFMSIRFLAASAAALVFSFSSVVGAQTQPTPASAADAAKAAAADAAKAPAASAAKAAAPVSAPQAAGAGDKVSEGKVAHYGRKFNGRKTASGQRFNSGAMTMAHKTLPFGTLVKVTNLANKRSVVVRVNDRGPTADDRIGDLTTAAARKIKMTHSGVIQAKLEVMGTAKARKQKTKK
jgi:rare lipoprotein A